MKRTFVQSQLSLAFGKLGLSVGRHPLVYIFVPVIISAVLSFGFFLIRLEKDFDYLFSPINGRSARERDAIESIFPPTLYSSNVDSVIRMDELVIVLMEPKDKGSVLREVLLEDAIRIDQVIRNISISWRNRSLTLADVCRKRATGKCESNDVLSLRGKIKDIKRNKIRLKYPIDVNEVNQRVSIYASGMGGVTTDDNYNVMDVKAMRIFYILDHSTTERKLVSTKWMKEFLDTVSRMESKHFNIVECTGMSINEETSRVTEIVWPFSFVAIPIMIIFALVTCMTTDCVTSKPWVAVAGSITPALGFVSAFGFLLTCGVKYIDANIAIPFIMMGIGLDDTFVMLASWRRTDKKTSVEERMSQTYTESAISITITSFTNIFALCVGFGSEFRVIRIYCTYATVSFLIAYIYQITFFGGVLAISGTREHKGLHCFTFTTVDKESLPDCCVAKVFYSGCGTQGKRNSISTYAQLIVNNMLTTRGKIVVIISFVLYLSSSLYCLRFITFECDYRDSVPYKSHARDYLDMHYKYFRKYGNIIQLVINETLDYSKPSVQRNIQELVKTFANSDHMGGEEFSYSWLNYYLQSTKDKKFLPSYYGYNFSDPNDFVEALTNVFLKFHNAKVFRNHIKFNENQTKIVASRFILLSGDIRSTVEEIQLTTTLWKKLDSSQYPIHVYGCFLPFFDAMIVVVATFTIPLFTAAGIVTAVFFIVIPHLFTTLSILLTTVSIQIGVIGYMSLWGVAVHPVSLICLIISIGLSVDYASHISYGYLSSTEENPNEKSKIALNKAGYPIIQGCLSTVLGISIISFAPSPLFLINFKIITLVMVMALFHGLFVIPVALNLMDSLQNIVLARAKKLCTS